jgi:ATP-dependent DNA helicase RecQ
MDYQFTITKKIDGFSYHALFKYYSERHYSDQQISKDDVLNRQAIADFKEGMNTEVIAERVAKAILQKATKNFNAINSVFMVIPASTQIKNIIRYKEFCDLVAEKLGIANGYNGIKILYDMTGFRGTYDESRIENLSFDSRYFTNKAVVLFDDLIITGDSFRQVAKKLIDLGAKKVTGAMLGETVAWDLKKA